MVFCILFFLRVHTNDSFINYLILKGTIYFARAIYPYFLWYHSPLSQRYWSKDPCSASWGLSPKFPFQKAANWYIYQTNMTLYQYNWLVKYNKLAKHFIGYSLIGDKKNIDSPLIQEVLQACSRDGAGKSMQDFQRSSCTKTGSQPYYGDQLSQLKMPVIFFAGEKDPLIPLKDIKNAFKKVPHAKLYIFPNCKHWAVKEKPHTFATLIQRYY